MALFNAKCVLLIMICFGTLSSCNKGKHAGAYKAGPKPVEVHDFASFQPMMHLRDDKVRVINFWATWCKPCIEELPFFEELIDSIGEERLEVILVSLDFKDQLEGQVIPFIEQQGLRSRVVLLDDPYENEWIPKVDSTWSGAIPATLIYRGFERQFYESSFTREELNREISKFLKK